MKKIIYYYQTFSGLNDTLKQDNPVVTHIHLSSIHFGLGSDKLPYIHLNNDPPNSSKFNSLWDDIKKASDKGIKIVLMVGGAGGAFTDLFNNFDIYYKLLKDTIIDHPEICGVDLDVEETVSLDNIKMLINKIVEDFGEEFIIAMAPLAYSLQNDGSGMGGFSYKELYNSHEGKYIDYFNGQFYGDYTLLAYENIINNGYPSEKIVMGMLSGDFSSGNFDEAINVVASISEKYDMCGVFVWEYVDCPPNDKDHYKWAENMYNALHRDLLKDCIIL